jgi:2-polyprenyl-3-methyl-5-hydroxy-6-metoxy-1,4-benzoquinol methylase
MIFLKISGHLGRRSRVGPALAPRMNSQTNNNTMTPLDRFLQNWRIRKTRPFVLPGSRVLDIGSADGVLFQRISGLASDCLGIDPTLPAPVVGTGFRLLPGFFPQDMPAGDKFDAITMLAVLEHFPDAAHRALATGCGDYLKPGGRLIITVPAPFVDQILKILTALRLVHGMSLEEHHGYDVAQTPRIFAPPVFRLLRHERFQLGLNHLFVFERAEAAG